MLCMCCLSLKWEKNAIWLNAIHGGWIATDPWWMDSYSKSGLMDRATVLVCRFVQMVVVILGSLSLVLSMALDVTSSGEFLIFKFLLIIYFFEI